MDFPVFHLDFFGNRLLIATIASLHVLINHMLAVGAVPMIAAMEWWGWRRRDARWDDLARRLLFVAFVVTTSLGALTGVGIWLSTSLVNPAAIGSLIRIFFWAWFVEWTVFVTEVALILVYFLTWKNWGARHKAAHIAVGIVLAVASWLTMAIIVAILGFQMDTGVWTVEQSFRAALLNPVYLPQLAFRTPLAMVTAGFFGLFLTWFFTRGHPDLRIRATRFLSVWTLIWTGPWLAGAWLYYRVVPDAMRSNLPVALGSMRFENQYGTFVWLIAAAVGVCLVVALWGVVLPRRLPGAALLLPALLAIVMLSAFERAREFVRKPYVIASYMYANALRLEDYPFYGEQGLLTRATYGPTAADGATADGAAEGAGLEAGEAMFRLACSRCHTTRGVNGVVAKLENLYGRRPWDPETVGAYLQGMHNARPFMPPLPGTAAERDALARYLVALQARHRTLEGAQTAGAAGRATAF
jgi:mono/diheme cytochrome c family protein